MIDIATNATGDTITPSGDFLAMEATATHQQSLLLANKGDFRQNPLTGIGAWNYIDDDGATAATPFAALARAIASGFTADGMDVAAIRISAAGTINTQADYV